MASHTSHPYASTFDLQKNAQRTFELNISMVIGEHHK